MVTDVPNMQRTNLGVENITTMPLNPRRCAVLVEVEVQQVTYNERHFIFLDSLTKYRYCDDKRYYKHYIFYTAAGK